MVFRFKIELAQPREGVGRDHRDLAQVKKPRGIVMLGTIVIVILILMLVGALPRWSHSASWGYAPSGMLGTILIVLLILVLLGKL